MAFLQSSPHKAAGQELILKVFLKTPSMTLGSEETISQLDP